MEPNREQLRSVVSNAVYNDVWYENNAHIEANGDVITEAVLNAGIPVRCSGHIDPAVNYYRRGEYFETHELTIEQLVALAEAISLDDWEDGPRCVLDVLRWESEDQ